MRQLHSFLAVSLLTISASACYPYHNPNSVGPSPQVCSLPTFANSMANYPSFHVAANAATEIPGGDRAFAVTSNGNGTYRLVWSDTAGYSTCFTGLITGIGNFSSAQVKGLSGREQVQLKQPNQIAFASVPGSGVDGVDFFADQDPVYLDVYADNSSAVNIYFTDTNSGLVSGANTNIAAFFSP